jgi:hypothetical protein
MTLTLSARPATTLLIGNRDSVRRGSGFVLVGYSERTSIFVQWADQVLEAVADSCSHSLPCASSE